MRRIILIWIVGVTLFFGGSVTKAGTIYVNPGESIQSAIDSLPEQGGMVELAAGVHNIDKTINITKKNVTLKGSGRDTTIINVTTPKTTAIVINLPSNPDATSIGPKQIMNTIIQDLKIHGYQKNQGAEGVGGGITGQEISNVTISNVWIENTYWGIALTGAKDYVNYINHIFSSELFIRNSTITDNWIGIWAGFTDHGTIESSEISFSSNWAIALNAANTHWTIKGNVIHDAGNSGISLYSGSGNNLVQNNIIYLAGTEGIGIFGAYDSVIENNTIYNTLRAGIRISPIYTNDNITIRNNLIYSNGILAEGYGIQGDYDSREKTDVIKIESNTIVFNKIGGIYSPFQKTIFRTKNNIISDNNGFGLNGVKIISNYNDIWNNTLGSYNGISSGSGDISANPLFANPGLLDFHLKSQGGRWIPTGWIVDTVASPAIDAGDPTSNYSLEPLPNGGRINMGAYGNTPEASKSSIVPPPPLEDLPKVNNIKVSPNPYIKGKSSGEKINFGNLSQDATIRIYTLAGKLVAEIEHRIDVDGGLAEWGVGDVKSGVYLYVITSIEGTSKGKIGVVK